MTTEQIINEIYKSFDTIDKYQIRALARKALDTRCALDTSHCILCKYERACNFFKALSELGL